MMLHQSADPGEAYRQAVARLTQKERECLVRWLTHATAKEIALDLGITHHAVEKRLKSARQKLQVTTTLEAARQLAAVEGYGRTTSQPPEVAQNPPGGQAKPADQLLKHVAAWSRLAQISAGVLGMSIIVAALALVGGQAPKAAIQNDPPLTSFSVVVSRKTGQVIDLETALRSAFASMDKDGDKFIAGDEFSNTNFHILQSRDATARGSKATTVEQFDADGDKRVSEAEFRSGMASLSKQVPRPGS